MKRRTDMTIRRVGRKYMMVEAGKDGMNFADVYTLNEAAAALWERIGDGEVDIEALSQWLSQSYQIDLSLARTDVTRQVEEWKEMGLIG
ncbi:MAG: PqqD family protein [Bacteroidaceae bacterium]